MKREEYMFTLGYSGDSALVDRKGMNKYAKASMEDLCAKGLFKPAISRALWDDNQGELESILEIYNRENQAPLPNTNVLVRAFGVQKLPEGIRRTIYL